MDSAIAIVGMACCYPDARTPIELWENVLAQRRAFRRLPPERLSLTDYFSADPGTPDAIYAADAALIDGYTFDRTRFRVAGPVYRGVDLAHWLALDVADRALTDAGLADGRGLPLDTTGVLVGNTLTGELSRASALRLRWPYVQRVVSARLREEAWDDARRTTFLRDLEALYNAPFEPVSEETLAGALSNTIAGRICNHFHFGGGGYTLDGACCSSLLAIARACSALAAGELDAALAGGVDVSLDPFELVGFAKAGALAHGEMCVYDRDASGFLPGEGCGFVVLMRAADAIDRGLRPYALIRGWGVSSDGGGHIMRPEARGQTLALARAYARAGYGADSVALFEGHGTGTPVGDEVELTTLSAARRGARADLPRAAVGSIKANIGHTKAAAGVAGLIKAAMAVHQQVLPPATGIRRPRPELEGDDATLRVLDAPEPWPSPAPPRAGVNSFGFGGINVHVTLEGQSARRASGLSPRERVLASTAQDAELFLFAASTAPDLIARIDRVIPIAFALSASDLTDFAATLAGAAASAPTSDTIARAAIVAATPSQLDARLRRLRAWLAEGTTRRIDVEEGICVGLGATPPRIVFLFPGQASPVRVAAGLHGRRFALVADVYRAAALPADADPASPDPASTATAQIAIIAAELAGLRLLDALGIQADAAIGHSLGELSAYAWAGALDDRTLLDVARARGAVMARLTGPPGAMVSIAASMDETASMIAAGDPVVIACVNGPRQTVIAGARDAVARVASRANARGWPASLIPAAHAFHSPLMTPARAPFADVLASNDVRPLEREVVSTITGAVLPHDADLRSLLAQQLTRPVRFLDALRIAAPGTDLFIEVGPGRVLSHVTSQIDEARVADEAGGAVARIALDIAGPSLTGVLTAAAAAYALGAPLRIEALFADRFTRPFDVDRRPRFFVNPCELAPSPASADDEVTQRPSGTTASRVTPDAHDQRSSVSEAAGPAIDVLRDLVARRTELPASAIADDARLLRDLHLNSIVVGELVAAAARRLGLAPPGHLLAFADATLGDVARALDRLRATGVDESAAAREQVVSGVGDWVRAFRVAWRPRMRAPRAIVPRAPGRWRVFAPADHPLTGPLTEAAFAGDGVLVCLPHAPPELSPDGQVDLLLDAAQAALRLTTSDVTFCVVQPACIAGSFARTLHLEHPRVRTRVIDAPPDARVVAYVHAEIASGAPHVEAQYDADGRRSEPSFEAVDVFDAPERPDVPADDPRTDLPRTDLPRRGEAVLVSGGGKGVAAECALQLALDTGARLVLLGRSRPEEDDALAAHLRRVKALGVDAIYVRADVTDAARVRTAVREAQAVCGPIVAILHGAGRNEPALLADLDAIALRRTLAPKVDGLRHLLAAIDVDRLRLLVTFGSVIGRVGLRGEADYALANAILTKLTQDVARDRPACRCLALESSAWAGVGMAERLGRIEALRREGIAPLPLDAGLSWFRRLLAHSSSDVAAIVSGRLGARAPLPVDAPPLPLLRFIERPQVSYPGIELVVDADLTTGSDPYVMDHVFHGEPLMPAVLGLEAIAQTVFALVGRDVQAPTNAVPAPMRCPVLELERVRFERPIVVEQGQRVTVRIAALAREAGRVDVVVRSSQTSFQVDHFRCVCRVTATPDMFADVVAVPAPEPRVAGAIDAARDLYGALLFQRGRFQRLAGYRRLTARLSWADIAPGAEPAWFSPYLPSTLVLGDPAARDAALHAIQACVPHAVLLPVAVDRVRLGRLPAGEALVAHARERWQDGATYCYDLDVRTPDGVLCERWEGLQLRQVARAASPRTLDRGWPDAFVAASLDWRLRELLPQARVTLALERDWTGTTDRRRRSERAIQQALGEPYTVRWRADGRPDVDASPLAVSAAHAGRLTLAVAGPDLVACDLESVRARPESVWRDLLGVDRWSLARLLATQADEDIHTSATRVWTAMESLAKSGVSTGSPLAYVSTSADRDVVTLSAAGVTIVSAIVRVRDDPAPVAIAVLARSEECAITSTGTESRSTRPTSSAMSIT